MKIFQKFSRNLAVSFFVMCLWANVANAIFTDLASVGVDNAGNSIVIWRLVDPDTDNHQYRGAVESMMGFIVASLSDPMAVEGDTSPVLAVATGSPSGSTIAAAAWTATDLSTSFTIVQVITATDSGWNTVPFTLSDDMTGNEIPQGDHRITISPDGAIITVTWSSFFTTTGDTLIRLRESVDGGTTWSTVTELS